MGGAKVRERAYVEVRQGALPLGGTPASVALPQPRVTAFVGLNEVQAYDTTTADPALTCSKLTLRPLTPDDFDAYRVLRSRNRASLQAFEPEAPEGMVDPTESAEAFEAGCILAEAARWHGTGYAFGVFVDGQLAGEAELGVVRGATESASFNTWVDEGGKRNGLASAAFTLLCRYAFEQLGLQRVECLVMPTNTGVRAALKNAGVAEEGICRAGAKISGVWEDHVLYAITAGDWAERGDQMLAKFTA